MNRPDEQTPTEQRARELYQQVVRHNLHGRHGDGRALLADVIKAAKLAVLDKVGMADKPSDLFELRQRIERGEE